MSDMGQSYYEMCRSLGKTPDELGDCPGPARYFLRQAHKEHRRNIAEHIDD